MPPSRANAIASSYSVTVSIAALTIGTLSMMLREKRERMSTSRGCTSERRGTSRTSSKVRASGPTLSCHGTRSVTWSEASCSRSAVATPTASSPLPVERKLGRLLAVDIEIVVGAHPDASPTQVAVPAALELVVAGDERVVVGDRQLDAGRGQRLEKPLRAQLG